MNAPRAAKNPPTILWWIIWAAILSTVVGLAAFMPVRPPLTGPNPIRYLPIAPLVLASVVRWLVLPRFTQPTRAFPIFIVGIALAEASAVFGIFLVPELRGTYVILALLGIAQFAPVFLSRFESGSFTT